MSLETYGSTSLSKAKTKMARIVTMTQMVTWSAMESPWLTTVSH